MDGKRPLIVFLSVFLLLAYAWADYPIAFEEIDTDASGYINKDEVNVRNDLSRHFKDIDTDGNGKITIDEYQKYEGIGRFSPPEESESPELGATIVE